MWEQVPCLSMTHPPRYQAETECPWGKVGWGEVSIRGEQASCYPDQRLRIWVTILSLTERGKESAVKDI